jgi:hypothetical protein
MLPFTNAPTLPIDLDVGSVRQERVEVAPIPVVAAATPAA